MHKYKQRIIKLQHCRKASGSWDGSHRNMNGWKMRLQKMKLPLWAVLTSMLCKDTIDSYFILLGMDEATAGVLVWCWVLPRKQRRNGVTQYQGNMEVTFILVKFRIKHTVINNFPFATIIMQELFSLINDGQYVVL